MTTFSALRAKHQSAWLEHLRARLAELLEHQPQLEQRPDQIWLFGSRARGDWDGWSDTDLLVVAQNQGLAAAWADLLIGAGLGGDVIPMDRSRWQALPSHASAIWRAVAREALPLLAADQP
jgi:predicted nucleotidyltransferase